MGFLKISYFDAYYSSPVPLTCIILYFGSLSIINWCKLDVPVDVMGFFILCVIAGNCSIYLKICCSRGSFWALHYDTRLSHYQQCVLRGLTPYLVVVFVMVRKRVSVSYFQLIADFINICSTVGLKSLLGIPSFPDLSDLKLK